MVLSMLLAVAMSLYCNLRSERAIHLSDPNQSWQKEEPEAMEGAK